MEWRKDNSNAPYLLYNIYADNKFPVDINNPGNLVQTRLKEETTTIPNNDKLFYAVTAMDRYGNESNAIQEKRIAFTLQKHPYCGSIRMKIASYYHKICNTLHHLLLLKHYKGLHYTQEV